MYSSSVGSLASLMAAVVVVVTVAESSERVGDEGGNVRTAEL